MRKLIPALLVCFLLGCQTHTRRVTPAPSLDPFNPATLGQVERAKQRLHLLGADMAPEQIFTTLGLANCYGHCVGVSNGSSSRFLTTFVLRNHHNLNVVNDYGHPGQNTLVSVELDGSTWPSEPPTINTNIGSNSTSATNANHSAGSGHPVK